jgi:predicted nucleic acid-binding protein
MPVLLDTGILYAYYDRSDAWHARARAAIRRDAGALMVPALVIPEVDHLLGHRFGARARHLLYRSLASGDYDVIDLPHDRIARVVEIDRQFASLDLGFVDAALIALAESTTIRRIATTDRRHFDPVAAALRLELVP